MGIRTRRARAHSKTHFVGFGLAGVLGFIALLCVTLALSLGAVVSTWLEDLPDYTSADAFLVAEPTRVYDADGNEIVAYYLQNRRSVTLDRSPTTSSRAPSTPRTSASTSTTALTRGHSARGGGPGLWRRRAGRRLHDHPAARPLDGPLRRAVRELAAAQGPRGVHRHPDGEDVHEGTDPQHVPQHHLLRQRCLRHRGGGHHLLQQERRRPHAQRGGHARGHPQLPHLLRPLRELL